MSQVPQTIDPLKTKIAEHTRCDESTLVQHLLPLATVPQGTHDLAYRLVVGVRQGRLGQGGLDAFLFQYNLSSEEGIALMCLAEALLRIPDKHTIDKLIKDKLSSADWSAHLGQSKSLFVNAATWALMLTGKIMTPESSPQQHMAGIFKRFTARTGEPIVRQAVIQAMRILGRQFVMGRTIEESLKRAEVLEKQGYRYSYDMLGEAAHTMADADRYQEAYLAAIRAVGQASAGRGPVEGPGVSVKLSALHPHYHVVHRQQVIEELLPRLKILAREARALNVGLTVDAEEAHRLMLSLDLVESVLLDPEFHNWSGFGLAVQAYQKRAVFVIDWLVALGQKRHVPFTVRLVKGAYWDTEIKDSQVNGYDYAVFTRKITTDMNYLVCAKKLLEARDVIYPQFATHNAHTVAAIVQLAGDAQGFEFQCLHGMGEALYQQIVGPEHMNLPCRIYAPVGSHEDLLPYLVRRLLENGANTSFVNRIVDERLPIEDLIADPVAKLQRLPRKPHPLLPHPKDLFGQERPNSEGLDLSEDTVRDALNRVYAEADTRTFEAISTFDQPTPQSAWQDVIVPYDVAQVLGRFLPVGPEWIDGAMERAQKAQKSWAALAVEERASLMENVADLMVRDQKDLMHLLCREAGKTHMDALNEVREAIDFCRYYAVQARQQCVPKTLVGPTGEHNQFSLKARGTLVCISPWNFPLAIFTGQVVAAAVCGNTVLAKPAEQTPLVAAHAVRLMHEAGIPQDVVQLVLGPGRVVGEALLHHPEVAGVLFTGSTGVAHHMQQVLAQKKGPIVPFVAETGGQNVMMVDSSALMEQVVVDVISSGFHSAGQRCSALRVLYVQEDILDRLWTMLTGAMAIMKVGRPDRFDCEVGPVIDQKAQKDLLAHCQAMKAIAQRFYQVPVDEAVMEQGTYVPPSVFQIERIDQVGEEHFGPILHVIPYVGKQLDAVIREINSTGYGLTFGIHSRIQETVSYVCERVQAGNLYVNRNMIGAVVGVQPFGGRGLSGTGPKAGGPHYLARLCSEQTLSVNTAAAGGNTSLMTLSESV